MLNPKIMAMFIFMNSAFVSISLGQKITNLYPSDTLKKWRAIYEKNIRLNFQEYVIEKGRVTVPMELAVVLKPEKGIDDYNFYSRGNTVYIPVSALVFLDQVCVAYCWLVEQGYDLETIFDYMGMLKLQHFPNGFPAVHLTLGIPARVSMQVNESAKALTSQALLWLMAHEAGHIINGHTEYVNPPHAKKLSSMEKELEADKFATSVFRQLHVVPIGTAVFFTLYLNLMTHRGDYPTDGSWNNFVGKYATHPLSSERLSFMASDLKTRPQDFVLTSRDVPKVVFWAGEMQKLADTLSNPMLQQLFVYRALMAKPEYLAPRQKGDVNAIPVVQSSKRNFEGMYSGMFTHKVSSSGKIETVPAKMSMIRDGNEVRGCFNFGLGVGTIQGKLTSENELSFNWQLANDSGKGILKNTGNEKSGLTGTWGMAISEVDGGKWQLKKELVLR